MKKELILTASLLAATACGDKLDKKELIKNHDYSNTNVVLGLPNMGLDVVTIDLDNDGVVDGLRTNTNYVQFYFPDYESKFFRSTFGMGNQSYPLPEHLKKELSLHREREIYLIKELEKVKIHFDAMHSDEKDSIFTLHTNELKEYVESRFPKQSMENQSIKNEHKTVGDNMSLYAVTLIDYKDNTAIFGLPGDKKIALKSYEGTLFENMKYDVQYNKFEEPIKMKNMNTELEGLINKISETNKEMQK